MDGESPMRITLIFDAPLREAKLLLVLPNEDVYATVVRANAERQTERTLRPMSGSGYSHDISRALAPDPRLWGC
jgi:hypothetical protein